MEKILIDQSSTITLANKLNPGTARGIDQIDFAKLDSVQLNIIGALATAAFSSSFSRSRLASAKSCEQYRTRVWTLCTLTRPQSGPPSCVG